MDTSVKLQFAHLRARLATGRLEKASLANEIVSTDTTPGRKEKAVHRYSRLIAEMRMIADELEILVAATKLAEVAKNPL